VKQQKAKRLITQSSHTKNLKCWAVNQ